MTYQTLNFAVEDGVATITLNRPEAANAIDRNLAVDFKAAAIQSEEDPAIRAIIVTGAGPMFCPGGDLKYFTGLGDGVGAALDEITTLFHDALSRFARMDAPVIMAVNGVAAGGGMSLAIAGDLVYAATSAKFTMAYTMAGLSPDGGSTYNLPRIIGLRRAQELILTNRTLTAAEAKEWGLVTDVFGDAELMNEARAAATRLARGPKAAHGSAKRLLADTYQNSMETQMAAESAEIAARAADPDGREGCAAFAEKRIPVFNASTSP